MDTLAGAGQTYWHGVLAAGGSTTVPRWTRNPAPGVAEHVVAVSTDLAAALSARAAELAVSPRALLLAAHAVVLAALSGEREVITGYVATPGAPPLPCRLSTQPDSWRTLIKGIDRIESQLLAHRDFPVDALRRELSLTGPAYETAVDPSTLDPADPEPSRDLSGWGELTAGTMWKVGLRRDGDRLGLRLRYRSAVLDLEAAHRVAGYHLTALRLIAADPDAEHRRGSLLSAAELRVQLDGLAGPHRELPEARFHELFERRVRAHPDAVAVVRGDRVWTYAELNAHANRLGRALLARGLRREDVVAVVAERTLDWMAAVLAVFKAGGAYLPIEPRFPAERIATTLSRAGCTLVLTEPGSATTVATALDSLPGVRALSFEAAYAEAHPDTDLGVSVTPDQLAYLYFTSGSTGEPKGAMCEHAGLLNHLYAKIDDLEISEGQVVAQTAPQCFDISLWQLVSALLVGGRTLLVEQEVILDVARFVDRIVDGLVTVLQVVPSYLEVVLSYLEAHPRPLPDLRYVSVTGEALKKKLVQRWFATAPGIRLVNAYGLTETSDDTNHEVMDGAPDSDRVPLGRCVNNVRAYIVDEHLALVPLGAPGAIVFSGVCVGRGYVNDPDRTRQAFLADPYRPGQRLYQAGDFGRWRPDGKLEYLGRRDTQVKVRGFRIEIGEIDNTLLRVPGVRDGAVVVVQRPDASRHLVAFYTAARPLRVETLRAALGASLPEYMVPVAFYWRDRLPLTANSKIDRGVLSALATKVFAAEPSGGRNHQAPGTPTERRLAVAWAGVLGVPVDQVGRHDHFFDRGGTSLSAVKLAIALERMASIKEIVGHPVLADLAALLDGRLWNGRGATPGGATATRDPMRDHTHGPTNQA